MNPIRALTLIVSIVAALALALFSPQHAALAAVCAGMVAVTLRPPAARVCATLTVAEILSDTLEAFKTMLPALRMMSADMSAENVKFGQQVIAHLPILPTAYDVDRATGYRQNAQSANTLLSDVPIIIDQHKHVPIKMAMADVCVDRSQNYIKTINNSGYVLAKAVVDYALTKARRQNFSQSTTESINNTDRDTLGAVRKGMNTAKAGTPRFGLVSSDFFEKLDADPRIASKDYYGQQTGGSVFGRLKDVAGFSEILEYPDFPSNNITLGTFTAVAATEVITVSAAHGLIVGDRVQVSNAGGALPAGLTAATDYTVATVPSATTLTLTGVNITDTGTGVHTMTLSENLSGFFFDDRAIGVATRLPMDGAELAKMLGIPTPLKIEVVQDSGTGLALAGFGEFDTTTHDVFVTTTIMFGAVAGRQAGAAGAKTDYAGHRVQTS